MSYLFLKLSRLFFDIALIFDREKRVPISMWELKPLQKCDFGVFIKIVEKRGVLLGMFANRQIGFFYRDKVFQEEVLEVSASIQDIEEIKKYIVDKIVQGHEQLEILDEI